MTDKIDISPETVNRTAEARIKELEAKLEALDHAYDSIVQALRFEALRTDDAEAKLAKAKPLMERIARGDFTIMTPPDYVTDPPPSAQDLARAAIAELKG